MIFADMQYAQHYSDIHAELVTFLSGTFKNIEHGLQGDSWIWIIEGNQKVEIDTFGSMKHQIKSNSLSNDLTQTVIETLSRKYQIKTYLNPEPEPHEDD